MKLHKHLRIILLSACLSPSLAMGAMAIDTQPKNINAANSTVSKDDLSAQKELFQMQLDAKNELIQLQLDAKKELLQKDIEAQAKRIDAFDKRLDDQTSRISDIGSQVERFGILITVLFVVAGFLGYRTAKNDAKETAREAASQWFNDNHIALNSQIEKLEKRAAQASENIDDYEEKVAQKSNEFNERVDALFETQMENIQRQLTQSTTGKKSKKQLPKDNSAIEQKAEKLKQLPEIEYTFTDWNARAFAAYSEEKLEDAIFYWDKAVSASDIQPEELAQTMFNKGTTLDQLNRNEEAIAIYDAVIAEFGTSETLNLREQVASAMINKGCLLERLNRGEDAITVFEKVINEFGNEEELSFRKQVAIAMNNKGFQLLCKAKANWENLALAKDLIATASNICSLARLKEPNDGFANGNLAYISWLQGDTVAAEQHFKTGLAAATHGGEELYKATLTDFEIHPIAPDQGFRELVEKLWAEYQQIHSG